MKCLTACLYRDGNWLVHRCCPVLWSYCITVLNIEFLLTLLLSFIWLLVVFYRHMYYFSIVFRCLPLLPKYNMSIISFFFYTFCVHFQINVRDTFDSLYLNDLECSLNLIENAVFGQNWFNLYSINSTAGWHVKNDWISCESFCGK